jgi:hypothetical protein
MRVSNGAPTPTVNSPHAQQITQVEHEHLFPLFILL